ncbi:DUF6228 family protein [Streptomyces sp. NPDC059851]|uniref:DUF6228 family protein n=1 Tax=Streptomyces sp. NPDC059851 TaxID=3346971 RepID=UPI00365570E7
MRLRFAQAVRPYPEFPGDPLLDFLVTARGERADVEVRVRTFDGDGLDSFLGRLAEDFRGWEGARIWGSVNGDLTLSARHGSGGHVSLTWGLHDQAPDANWHFEATTVHEAGEDMRGLAAAVSVFLRSSV